MVADGKLDHQKRNALLSKMSDEVAELVLANNKKQNLAISLAPMSHLSISTYIRGIWPSRKSEVLSRELSCLPSDKVLIDRKTHEVGLTRPEIAVLMALVKILKQYILIQIYVMILISLY